MRKVTKGKLQTNAPTNEVSDQMKRHHKSSVRTRRLSAVVAGLAAAALLPFAVAPAGAVSFSNPAPINIPLPPLGQLYTPAELYPSTISVSGFTGTVTDVNVTLCGFTATFPSDVNVMLVAPGGVNAMIMSDVGGNGGTEGDPNPEQHDRPVSNLTLTLDDQAANPLPADSQLTSGTWRPVDDDIGEYPLNENPDEDQFPFPAPAHSGNVALSSFNGINPNGTWQLWVFDDFPAQPADGEFVLPNFSCGWSIDITSSGGGPTTTIGESTTSTAPTTTTTAPPAEPVPPVADFDGDGDTDVSVYRPANGLWFVSGGSISSFGTTGDIPVPGDYDGDGDTDVAVFRPANGYWFVQGGGITQFGTAGDIPVPADYDGDGDTDIAVFRPSSGFWFVNGGAIAQFGASGDIPVPGDYDGDGDADFAVFRPSSGTWFIQGQATVSFGASGDIPVPADYDGDGDVNIAVFRPSNGVWFFRQGNTALAWGTSGDIPVPGDYNGDGDAEVAVFRPSNGVWFVHDGPTVAFGTSGDVPLPLPDAIRRFFFPPL